MKRIIRFTFVLFLISGAIMSSCKKDEKPGSGEVEFSIAKPDEARSSLKSASVAPSSVVITVEDAGGNVVKNSEKLQLYAMGGNYITQPISLLNGKYKLTRFLVLDAENNVLYASPLKGSSMAYLVQNPLSVEFSVEKDKTAKLIPEVIATAASTAESFGYTTFSFSVTETFDFLIGTFIYNESLKNYELTLADISIYSDSTLIYTGQLTTTTHSTDVNTYDSVGVNNKITLPERYNNYTLVISKAGYKTYTYTITKDELKLHYLNIDKGPLVAVLQPELNEDNDFYIRGYFDGEYLSYKVDTSLYFNNHTMEIVACENLAVSNRNFTFYFRTRPSSSVEFDIDNLILPDTITQSSNISALFNFRKDSVYNDPYYEWYVVTGLGLSYMDFTIIIDSISNDIIQGRFFGEISTDWSDGGPRMKVNGEFRSKLTRVNYQPWFLNDTMFPGT